MKDNTQQEKTISTKAVYLGETIANEELLMVFHLYKRVHLYELTLFKINHLKYLLGPVMHICL